MRLLALRGGHKTIDQSGVFVIFQQDRVSMRTSGVQLVSWSAFSSKLANPDLNRKKIVVASRRSKT